MKIFIYKSRQATGWFLIIFGALSVGSFIPGLYMVTTGVVAPREPIYIDLLAPRPDDAVKSIFLHLGFIVLGFYIKPGKRKATIKKQGDNIES